MFFLTLISFTYKSITNASKLLRIIYFPINERDEETEIKLHVLTFI